MLNRFYTKYGKRTVVRTIIASILAVLVVVGMFVYLGRGKEVTTTSETPKPQVRVSTVQEFVNQSMFSVVGTVRAVSEAKLETEAGGRITGVAVNVGDFVPAGTVLASIENSGERAQLLQAEGAYESALAGSLQGGASFNEAKVGVRNAYRDTFSTTDSTVANIVDQFFTKIEGLKRYGFKMDGAGVPTADYVDNRMAIEPMLATWSMHITNNFVDVTEEVMLSEAETTIIAVSNLTAALATAVSDSKNKDRFTDSEKIEYTNELAGARVSLDAALGTISRARSTYEQAQLTGDAQIPSQSSAGIKSALGALRSAQTNYEKTLVRTPISGVVNALYLTAGAYVNPGQPAALVANNGALEISTALGEDDLETIVVGDIVRINETATGTIARIAPAIDPLSGKSEVRISIDDAHTLKNGSTVSVVFSRKRATHDDGKITIPLSALKLLPSGPIAFSVNGENVLVVIPVVLGAIVGDSVEILSGLTDERVIVRDARGLKEGDAVTVAPN